ncbi:unnamed protein product [Strongylus vulgaris]|uniref:Uncharacterized protein n=1 Tax=Strongylus vulgaris TaxID=40348 RepID=A0A3P7JII1_STRVU|nr:unnamed protein product [Strongylus vulgaris]
MFIERSRYTVTDIWRSYFAQKLLHLVGERVAFYPVNAIQFRNAHDYLADFEQELDVYMKSGEFVELLESWHCESSDISTCAVELAEELGRLGFWQKKDAHLVKLWIDDLKSIGYDFPKMITRPLLADCIGSIDNEPTCHPAHIELITDMPLNHSKKALKRMKQKLEYAEDLHNWCRKSEPAEVFTSFSYDYLAEKHSKQQSLVDNLGKALIVVADQDGAGLGLLQRLYQPYFAVLIFCGRGDFIHRQGNTGNSMNMADPVNYITLEANAPLFAMTAKCLVRVLIIVADQDGAGLGLLQRLYQPYFAVLIFCGRGDFIHRQGNTDNSMNMTDPVNYIALEANAPLFAMTAKCLVRVQQMKLQNVTGYYAVSDAVILQMWNWHDPKKVLFPSQGKRPNEALWKDANGLPSSKTVYQLITGKYKDDEAVQKMWQEYQVGLLSNRIHQSPLAHLQSDAGFADSMFIYLPADKIEYFSDLVQIFDEAKIPKGFAVAKFLDTVEVEWLPSLANVLTNDGKVDTKSLILANPTRFSEHAKIEERKL